MRHRFLLALGSLVLMSGIFPARAQDLAFRRTVGSIVVDRPSYWQNWEYQNDFVRSLNVPVGQTKLFNIDGKGIWPRFFRDRKNASLEAELRSYADVVRAESRIVQGGASALTNERMARFVIDDDLATYWEPAEEDFDLENGLRNWELLVDLGGEVFVDSITVIFPSGNLAGEDLGDPLKKFAVLGAFGERSLNVTSTDYRFDLIGKATDLELQPVGGDGRLKQITFRLLPLDEKADIDEDGVPDLEGSFLQYIRIKVVDSDFERKIFIGEGEQGRVEYESLSSERRGDRVFQRVTAGGFLAEVSESTYNSLPADRQGAVRYFMRELPRVMEVQAWTKGDNVSLQPEIRAGGSYEGGGGGTTSNTTDGIYQTWWVGKAWTSEFPLTGTMWLDLGATFWVDKMLLSMKQQPDAMQGAFYGHEFLVSDGTLLSPVDIETVDDFEQLENALKWENIIGEPLVDNRDARVRMFEQTFARRKIRFLQLRNVDISGEASGRYNRSGNLSELHLYGRGYPVSVWLYSPPIFLQGSDAGDSRVTTLAKIAWEGEVVVRQEDPLSGEVIEVAELLEFHPDVELQIQTRTSDSTDSLFTYFELAGVEPDIVRQEIEKPRYDDLVLQWRAWDYWQSLPASRQHLSNNDDDGDGEVDEDPIDFIDNDLDGEVDEDGKKLRRAPRSEPDRVGQLAFVGWSSWSRPYRPTGGVNEAIITSPNPRKFLQVRVNLQSDNPNKTVRIKFLRVDLVSPLSLEMGAELALLNQQGIERPVRDLHPTPDDYQLPRGVDPLKSQTYSYFIRAAEPDPQQSEVREGFDEILIITKQAAVLRGIRLGEVRVVEEMSLLDSSSTVTRALETEFTHFFERAEGDSLFRDAEGNVLEVLSATGSDSLHLHLPFSFNTGSRLGRQIHSVAEVQFEVKAFAEGTTFPSFVRDSKAEDPFFQRVEIEGRDVTELIASSTAQISLDNSFTRLIQKVDMVPVITPNGDGVNDQLRADFVLLRILEERPVEMSFYNLSNSLVGRGTQLGSTAGLGDVGTTGQLSFSWDGLDLFGKLVPPGVYLCRIKVDADAGVEEVVRVVHVVY